MLISVNVLTVCIRETIPVQMRRMLHFFFK